MQPTGNYMCACVCTRNERSPIQCSSLKVMMYPRHRRWTRLQTVHLQCPLSCGPNWNQRVFSVLLLVPLTLKRIDNESALLEPPTTGFCVPSAPTSINVTNGSFSLSDNRQFFGTFIMLWSDVYDTQKRGIRRFGFDVLRLTELKVHLSLSSSFGRLPQLHILFYIFQWSSDKSNATTARINICLFAEARTIRPTPRHQIQWLRYCIFA